MHKTIRHWWKKSEMTETDGEIYHVLGYEESLFSKWLYYPKQAHSQCNTYQTTNAFVTEIEQQQQQKITIYM